jgi:hypothetical protein
MYFLPKSSACLLDHITPAMSIYNGMTPQGYLIMVLASIGAILYVSATLPRLVLISPRALTTGGGARS